MGLHDKSRLDGRGPRLIVMVAAIFVVASLIVVLRSNMVPARTRVQPAASGQSLASFQAPTCPVGHMCADSTGTTTTWPTVSVAETHLVDLVNVERGRTGCPALQLNERLTASARAHAEDMASRAFADLTNPDHEGPGTRAQKVGYRGDVSEIIAAGLSTPDEVFAQWTDLHNPAATAVKAKMDDCSRVSVGVAYQPGQVKPTFGDGIWVLDMGDA